MRNKRKAIPTDTVLVFFALIFFVMSILTACGAEETLLQEETEPALPVVTYEPDNAGEILNDEPVINEPDEENQTPETPVEAKPLPTPDAF
ncbi:MAG: hypothetical protein II680_09795, partial [Clostridia bacterium]|nr:hypothetical protein [Clostridia bacterium]